MKTRPVQAARISWGGDDQPASPDLAADANSLQLARQHALAGNGLPGRWAGRAHFAVLHIGFGLGADVLATWDAWRRDTQRCAVLHIVAIDAHPPLVADLRRAAPCLALPDLAAPLLAAWPPLTPGIHALSLDQGQVHLTLAWGEPRALLPELNGVFDAFNLRALASGAERATQDIDWIVRALARRATAHASLSSPVDTPALRQALSAAGFVPTAPGAQAQTPPGLSAVWQPRFVPRGPARRAVHRAAETCDAAIIGAGLAGASVAHALQRQGWQVRVLDRHAAPAQEASGNPAGLFHGTVLPDDGPHARLLRAAALHATRVLRPLIESGQVQGRADGLLRLADADGLAAMRLMIEAQGLPPDYVQALDATQAAQRAGLPWDRAAWYYPGGGWLAPQSLVGSWLRGTTFIGEAEVESLRADENAWTLLDAAGRPLLSSRVLVLANADQAQRLLAPLGHAPWPLSRTRGQISLWRGGATPLALPVGGDGYALPLADGLLCGATTALDDEERAPRAADHDFNWQRLQRLCGLSPPSGATIDARVAWRVLTDDRLPIAGPLPLARLAPGSRQDQARLLPRTPGLFVCTALGGRGLTLAPLLGELLAAQICGTPLPLEQSLVDAVDPGRWRVRAARRGGRESVEN